jgi:N-acetylneuraminic acid mutarotase
MKNKNYKNLLIIIIYLFLVSAVQQGFSQENWAPTSTGNNVPSNRARHTAVWTGAKMIVWGGYNYNAPGITNTGGIYDPVLDSWTVTSTGANCPLGRDTHTAVWTGTKMIVWGGLTSVGPAVYNTGGVYDPLTDTWTATSTSGAPTARDYHTAVWTGSKMIVWGGYNSVTGLNYNNAGGVYDPLTDTWTATSTTNAPTGRRLHTAVWTGSKMIIWGGLDTTFAFTNTGGIYDPVTDSWTPTSVGVNVPSARGTHTAVWTGSKMIIWGGTPGGISYNDGGIYDPLTDTWTATSTTNAPVARYAQTAVWTGNRMIIWGGVAGNLTFLNTGGIYDPIADSWSAITTANVPDVRDNHTAVMTAASMIVWGGTSTYPVVYNSGGIYTNPAVIGITAISTEVPGSFSLSQNYPNPFNPNSKIKFQIAKLSNVKLVVIDILGREVTTLVNENVKPGTYEVDFDGSKFSSGVYFYKLQTESFSETKKMLMVK